MVYIDSFQGLFLWIAGSCAGLFSTVYSASAAIQAFRYAAQPVKFFRFPSLLLLSPPPELHLKGVHLIIGIHPHLKTSRPVVSAYFSKRLFLSGLAAGPQCRLFQKI